MLDADPLAQALSPARGGEVLAEAVLESLVLGDVDGAPRAGCSGRALGALGAVVAGFGVELRHGAELDWLHLACQRS